MRSKAVTKAQVKSMIVGITEPKVNSTQATGTTISSSGVVIPLSQLIIEGDGLAARSGEKITILSVDFKFRFLAITNDQSARFILFRDQQSVGVVPTVTEVLPTTGLLSHYSDVRYQQQHRFSIIFDEIIDCSVNGPSVKTMKQIIRKRMPVYYNGGNNAATANGKGAFYLLVIGSLSTGVFDYDVQTIYNDS
jgi:hypothetical protein